MNETTYVSLNKGGVAYFAYNLTKAEVHECLYVEIDHVHIRLSNANSSIATTCILSIPHQRTDG